MTPGSTSALNYSYDASSNLTELPTGATTSYDDSGELVSSTLSSTTTTYTYNADGERTVATGSSATDASASYNGAGELAGDSTRCDTSATTYDGNGLRPRRRQPRREARLRRRTSSGTSPRRFLAFSWTRRTPTSTGRLELRWSR